MSGLDPATAFAAKGGLSAPGAPFLAAGNDPAKARKAAEDFTSFFFNQSLDSMYANVSSDQLFGGGTGEDIYRSLMLTEYSKVAARSATGRGITDAVQREIMHLQEVAK